SRSANQYRGRVPLTPNAAKAILQYTALGIHDDAGIAYNALRQGAGSLNAKGAIDLGRAVDTSVAPGRHWLTSSPTPWTSIGGESLVWNQMILWGTQTLWGNTVSVNENAWSTMILWGTHDVAWSTSIVWGTDAVWSDPQSWADAIVWGTDTIGYDQGSMILWGTTGGLTEATTAWKDLAGSTTSQGTTVRQ